MSVSSCCVGRGGRSRRSLWRCGPRSCWRVRMVWITSRSRRSWRSWRRRWASGGPGSWRRNIGRCSRGRSECRRRSPRRSAARSGAATAPQDPRPPPTATCCEQHRPPPTQAGQPKPSRCCVVGYLAYVLDLGQCSPSRSGIRTRILPRRCPAWLMLWAAASSVSGISAAISVANRPSAASGSAD